MSEEELNAYRLTSMEEPTDEISIYKSLPHTVKSVAVGYCH